jgi:hypothetical protein
MIVIFHFLLVKAEMKAPHLCKILQTVLLALAMAQRC